MCDWSERLVISIWDVKARNKNIQARSSAVCFIRAAAASDRGTIRHLKGLG
jgi:hypothetical protein